MKKQQAILSLGSNLGNRLELLQQALTLLERHSIQIKSLSSLY
ncbi:MAG TPA: 2-amino-4-hydroxy-6-hydroxymethyldihydropteridine diphosphokinase, partial [Flavobacteriaceae bacterium]|nr:2-amino-4-hydroxy-6-hydroxymethyldihydropteridine diphosphokinase [Flavobacteriaceae bacterium]